MHDACTLAAARRRRLLARRDAGRLLTRQRLARADMSAAARRATDAVNGFVAAWTEQADEDRLDAMINRMWENA